MPQKVRCWKKVIQVALYMRIILTKNATHIEWGKVDVNKQRSTLRTTFLYLLLIGSYFRLNFWLFLVIV